MVDRQQLMARIGEKQTNVNVFIAARDDKQTITVREMTRNANHLVLPVRAVRQKERATIAIPADGVALVRQDNGADIARNSEA